MFTFIVLIVGACAVALTALSWKRNVNYMRTHIKNKDFMPSDLYIDYPIRVLWLIYISIFSVGFIVNNLFI
ncbi:MAG: hypothetical protein JNL74_19075 [Fibrobacteres bacterium]|nr:hypothetical protein [Fibrobacterota bacterium]